MDPDANVRERIDIVNSDQPDWSRYDELEEAYGQWCRSGGYRASRNLELSLLSVLGQLDLPDCPSSDSRP